MTAVRVDSFADLLKHYRVAAGLSQEDLADRAQLSGRAISDLERGVRRHPYPHTVQRLVQALDVDQEAARCLHRAAQRPGQEDRAEETRSHGPPVSLPVQPNAFIGRHQEIAEVVALLAQEEVRLLTFTGPGGVGKTRLALRVAECLSDRFPDGIVYVSLASLSDPELVPSAIAAVLGIKGMGRELILTRVTAHVRQKRLLLVLDNFEHLLPAAEVVSRLVAACPALTILVTSRAVLHLASEHEYPVPLLATPIPGHLPELDALSHFDAVQLFIQRVEAVKPQFRLTEDNAPFIAEICFRLDGLPLAIELAAARVRIFSPQALLAHLSDPLKLLSGGPRDVPPRQQSLKHTVDWSYALLSRPEQELFVRLSVFAGGWTLQAAEAVCNSDGDLGIDVFEGISSLADSSLVRPEREAAGEPRFTILESIRAFGFERLAMGGGEAAARDRHAAYFLWLAEQAHQRLEAGSAPEWLDRLQQDRDNLYAALSWLQAQGDSDRFYRLVLALRGFWSVRGYNREARHWLEAGLEHASLIGESARASILLALGVALNFLGQPELASIPLRESLGLFQQLGDLLHIGICWRQLGRGAFERGDLEEALNCYTEALATARATGRNVELAASLNTLGVVALCQGRYDDALADGKRSLALARARDAQATVVSALNNVGLAMLGQGDPTRAARVLDEGVVIARQNGLHWLLSNAFNSLGTAVFVGGDLDRATACQRDCLQIARNLQSAELMAYGLEGLALVAEKQGKPERAARLWAAAEPLRGELPYVTPLESELHQRAQQAARVSIGEAGFAAAWDEGRAMTAEDAVADALGESPWMGMTSS